MISETAVCFDCEEPIERLSDIVFMPPFEDSGSRQATATFHGLCVMRWRERRAEVRVMLQQARAMFIQHLTGECECE